jgi:hypothetical protein
LHYSWFQKLASHGPHPDLRLSKTSYENIRSSQWPEYDWYFKNGNNNNDELIAAEIQWAQNPEVVPGWFDQQFELIHSHQWNIDPNWWKSTEVWPDNENTLMSKCVDRPYRIFFTCADVNQWLSLPGKKIVLFTDVETQLRLAMYKKAWVYPVTFSGIKKALRVSKKHKNFNVSRLTSDALVYAEESVYLQDFVKEMLSGAATGQQQRFTKQWLSSHPASLLNRCNLGS